MNETRVLRLIGAASKAQPHELKAAILASGCYFFLLASYYILRPLRDTMATVVGVAQLQHLFTITFVLTLILAPLFAWCVAHMRLSRLLPGVFWLLIVNLLLFYVLFHRMPDSRWVAASYYCWFSVINLFLLSIFWTLAADIFSSTQATRLFAFVAAGGSLGAILGPLVTSAFAESAGVDGLLLVACGGFMIVIAFLHRLMREKESLRALDSDTQQTTLDHSLPGNPLDGFALVFRSRYLLGQALFFVLMTWIATILYFLQADFVEKSIAAVSGRTVAFANLDLFVNICSAAILIFGLGRFLQRFGVTASLALSPVLMVFACTALAFAPTLFVVQATRALQRISQYAVARPSREVLFTVLDQQEKYKAKNVIDTSVYRFGDLTAAWLQAGLRSMGMGFFAIVTLGVAVSAAWGLAALFVGRRYEALARTRARARDAVPAA
ncbi:MFS transporter [Sphingobium sufflavum]|uniref:NTP/NDP exchange transporter n=1 Tax=Sphingobium sufflavum TaxID=1129547 RepID=UPI001F297469|nr:MFS transporter [Sphingobium sufflavum]MCE7797225.1 MFS transporter [Sphingobium sufflavum]